MRWCEYTLKVAARSADTRGEVDAHGTEGQVAADDDEETKDGETKSVRRKGLEYWLRISGSALRLGVWGQVSSARIENLREPPSPGLETVSRASPPEAFCLAAPFIAPRLEAVAATRCSGIDETSLGSGVACHAPRADAALARIGVCVGCISTPRPSS